MEREPFDPLHDESDISNMTPDESLDAQRGMTPDEEYDANQRMAPDETLDANRGVNPEAETRGRDVQDVERVGRTYGADVTTSGEDPYIVQHGTTVEDHTHVAEEQGVDVIDLGPAEPTP